MVDIHNVTNRETLYKDVWKSLDTIEAVYYKTVLKPLNEVLENQKNVMIKAKNSTSAANWTQFVAKLKQ